MIGALRKISLTECCITQINIVKVYVLIGFPNKIFLVTPFFVLGTAMQSLQKPSVLFLY